MTRARIAAASAGILTVLLLQAALVGPVVSGFVEAAAVSLPAVAVAAVAFVDGPGAGMSFGFVTGLLADLGSSHPAGVLALCWLGVGLLCGRVADRHSLRHDAVSAGVICALSSAAAVAVLALLHARASWSGVLTGLVPTMIGDVLLAFPVLALLRRMLATDALRRPHPVFTDLSVGLRHG